MAVTYTSRKAYYDHVLSGRATSQKDRIMRYLLKVRRPVTRHEIVDNFFCVQPGPRALDGGSPIPWQSAGGAIAGLVKGEYVRVDFEGTCPVTGHLSEFLVPVGDAWAQRKLFG